MQSTYSFGFQSVIVVVQAAVGAIDRLISQGGATEVDHVEVAQLELDRRHGKTGDVGGRRVGGAGLVGTVVDVKDRVVAQFFQTQVVDACVINGRPVDPLSRGATDRQPGVDAIFYQRFFDVVFPGFAGALLPSGRNRLGGVDPAEGGCIQGGGCGHGRDDEPGGFRGRPVFVLVGRCFPL